jgi:hypothetical protein
MKALLLLKNCCQNNQTKGETMSFKTVTGLDTENVFALGGVDQKTGKKNPTSLEGYYLGSKKVKTETGIALIHVFQTALGNNGFWGSADTNSKLAQVRVGTMTKVEFVEKKKISGGKTKKIFNVMVDDENVIDTGALNASSEGAYDDDNGDSDEGGFEEEDAAQSAALADAEKRARTASILNKGKTK